MRRFTSRSYEIAKVLGRKQDYDGFFIGREHNNPILDYHVVIVELPDGETLDVAYNILAEHLYSQVDDEGNQYKMFKAIINHRKNKRAIEKADQYCSDGGSCCIKTQLGT